MKSDAFLVLLIVLMLLGFDGQNRSQPVEQVAASNVSRPPTYKEVAAARARGDFVTAAALLHKVAEFPNPPPAVLYDLGMVYSIGQGVTQNYAESAKWYRLAVDKGYSLAQFNLGVLYATGKGVGLNNLVAASLYRLSAKQGEASAQFNLGMMYFQGLGVAQNDHLADMWWTLASMNMKRSYSSGAGAGESSASTAVAAENAVYNKRIVEARMSRIEVLKAIKSAKRCAQTRFSDCE